MRMIGHLPTESSAGTFSDFLYVEGITNLIEAEKDGWAIWIHSEDQLEKAKELLLSYLGNPKDPKYQKNTQKVAELMEQDQQEQKAAQKRTYTRKTIFRSMLPQRVGPLTLVMICACLGVAAWSRLGENRDALSVLLITMYGRGLPELAKGEVWRVVTPIFIHFGILHLVFNMLWLADLGTMIESRKGTGRFALLVLVVAVTSNLGQFYNGGPFFGGMSGVVYGLLGYAWMKGRLDPASGLFVHPQTMSMMLIWLVLCMTPLIPHVANTAHAVGLAVGVAWGFLASLRAFRKQS